MAMNCMLYSASCKPCGPELDEAIRVELGWRSPCRADAHAATGHDLMHAKSSRLDTVMHQKFKYFYASHGRLKSLADGHSAERRNWILCHDMQAGSSRSQYTCSCTLVRMISYDITQVVEFELREHCTHGTYGPEVPSSNVCIRNVHIQPSLNVLPERARHLASHEQRLSTTAPLQARLRCGTTDTSCIHANVSLELLCLGYVYNFWFQIVNLKGFSGYW